MVSILPGESNWDLIGQHIGKGLSNSLPGAIEKRMDRQRGLTAIDELQKGIESAKGDPAKMLPLLMKAYTQNQGLERSGLGQKFLENAAAGMYPGALGEGSGQNKGVGGNVQSQPNPSITTPISNETQQPQPPELTGKKQHPSLDEEAGQYLAEVRPDLVNPATQYGAINTFAGINKQDLSAEDESRLRQQLMDKHKNPNIVNQVIDRVRESIKNKHNEALSQYKFDADKINQVNEKWNTFSQGSGKRLEPHIGKYGENAPKTKEILTNKYNKYASELPTNMTTEDMHANAMALVQRDINKLDALSSIPAAPPMRNEASVADYLNTNKKIYKDLADEGFTEALREDAYNNKDLGNEEFHSLIWGDQTSKPFLNKVHSIKSPKEYSKIDAANPIPKFNKNYKKDHEKYISSLSNTFKSMSPNDDLVLTRAMVLDNGGDIKDFNDALQMAEDNGLKLSPFQKSQLQETNIPRTPPLWEIFNKFGENPIQGLGGVVGSAGWAPFINYLRGKK